MLRYLEEFCQADMMEVNSGFFKDLGLNCTNRSVRCPGVGFQEMETLIIGHDRFWLHFPEQINSLIVSGFRV
jgi:hypothetical protein